MGRENNKSLSLASKRIPWDLYIPSIIVRTVTIAINNTSKKLVWWYEDSSLARKFAYVPIEKHTIPKKIMGNIILVIVEEFLLVVYLKIFIS